MTKILDKIRRIFFLVFNYRKFKSSKIYGIPRIVSKKNLFIGLNLHINENVFLHATGGITLGDNVILSYGATILSLGMITTGWSKRDVYSDGHVKKPVHIGSNVWICANVTVCPGVKIANNSIVAAGSVVCNDLLEENVLYAGIPARKIKVLS